MCGIEIDVGQANRSGLEKNIKNHFEACSAASQYFDSATVLSKHMVTWMKESSSARAEHINDFLWNVGEYGVYAVLSEDGIHAIRYYGITIMSASRYVNDQIWKLKGNILNMIFGKSKFVS
uniref:Uncharacterized protein n=1 Tax=Ditylenchus dipsaci TaxID=166011 RepID=A0A915E039_9BILA